MYCPLMSILGYNKLNKIILIEWNFKTYNEKI